MAFREVRYWILAILTVLLYAACRAQVDNAVTRPYPQTEGELNLPGLQDRVIVQRDEWGIPHIYAQNEPDLYLAQGFVHAQDRMWQMEFWRHISQGRVSEIVGEAGLESDKFIRTVGWNRTAEATVELFRETDPSYMSVLDSYADGVNAYLAQQDGNISYNYTVLGLTNGRWDLEPWTPVHTVGWGVVMAHDLSGNYGSELDRMELINMLGEETVEELYPPYDYEKWPVIVPSELMTQPRLDLDTADYLDDIAWEALSNNLVGRPPADGFAFGDELFVGSNNWVISGEHTDTGTPILANDPHLATQMPSIWYQVGLHAPGVDVVGFSFAGVPGVIVGHNDDIAWGVTNLGPDVQDLFIERINPDNPFQYEFEGEMLDMTTYEEVIDISGGEQAVLTVRETHHGPIISDVIEDVDQAIAMQWTALEPSRILQSVILLNKAENYAEFREALRFWDVPGQNFVYADVRGNIAYQSTGLVPIREKGIGLVPVPGWTGEYEWEGYIPYDEMPLIFNPPSGFIVTANHAAVDEDYPYFIEYSWANGDRGQRIEQMIEEKIMSSELGISTADIGTMQTDSYSLAAEDWVPYLLALPEQARNGEMQAALDALRDWDYQLRRDSVAASVFEIFYWQLIQETFADELGEEAGDLYMGHSMAVRLLLDQLADNEHDLWWDDVDTNGVIEKRDDIVLRSLQKTVTWLINNHGRQPSDWTWGNLHQVTFRSNPLGQSGIGLLENMVNIGPYPVDGGEGTVNAIGWRWSDPATVNWHPSMRMIVDMGDFDRSLAVIPTGQSGHPGHPHYDDLAQMWADGEFHPQWYSREAVDGNTAEMLILEPQAQE